MLAAVLLVALAPPVSGEVGNGPGFLQPRKVPTDRDVRWRRVGPQLTALHELYLDHLDVASIAPFDPGIPFLQLADGMVTIDAAADGDVAQLQRALERLGATDIVVFRRLVSARLPLLSIPELAEIQWLRLARPVMAISRIGSTTSQGDPSMRTDDARVAFGVDGAGFTVGVLSDSLDCGTGTTGDLATDVGTMDLPAGIEVLEDVTPCSVPDTYTVIDEGRAMAQLVHDIVPGSGISFHTARGGQANFALGIQELAGCPPGSEPGCVAATVPADVITDDVFYFAEPFFQDGAVAQAVDFVNGAGIPYTSSAGNSADSSWEGGPFVSSGMVPQGYEFTGVAHDFDPGPGVDIYQKVTFPSGANGLSLQWDQPFFSVSGAPGSANDLDICFYEDPVVDVSSLIGCGAAPNTGGDPVETGTLDSVGGGTHNVAIVKFTGDAVVGPDPGLMKYVIFRSTFSVVDPFGETTTGTLVGHANAAGAIATGAANYAETPDFGTDPPLLDSISSIGEVPILFDTAGTRLTSEDVRMKPEVVAPHCTNTTFFGSDDGDPDGFPNFCGTSAAAPHVAALIALMHEAANPAAVVLTPSGLESVLTSSAIDIVAMPASAGFDYASGYGLVDGLAAVGSVASGPGCDGAENLMLQGTPNTAPATFSATTSMSYGNGSFDQLTARSPVHVFNAGAEVGNASSFSGCS